MQGRLPSLARARPIADDGKHFGRFRKDRSFIMATSTVQGPMLFIKKLWGLLYVVLGCLGIAIGFETGSNWLIAAGIVALIVGVGLLALKVIRRNTLQ
jgi:hypothetical protein